jgi:purine nucleosidase
MAEVWFQARPEVTFHDPLAAVSIFEPEVCSYTRGQVEVELASPRLGGMTYFSEQAGGPHEVALGVNADGFFNAYFGITSA